MDKTILCIDDAVSILLLYQRIFEEHGYQVSLAANGWQGLNALNQGNIDCVVLDYRVAGLDGAAILGHMTRRGMTEAVILVSSADPPIELRSQVHAVLEKPMRVAELLQCVDRALRNRQADPRNIFMRRTFYDSQMHHDG